MTFVTFMGVIVGRARIKGVTRAGKKKLALLRLGIKPLEAALSPENRVDLWKTTHGGG